MRKILVVFLILLFVFAFIRIATSTYENRKRRNNAQAFYTSEKSIMTEVFVLT